MCFVKSWSVFPHLQILDSFIVGQIFAAIVASRGHARLRWLPIFSLQLGVVIPKLVELREIFIIDIGAGDVNAAETTGFIFCPEK